MFFGLFGKKKDGTTDSQATSPAMSEFNGSPEAVQELATGTGSTKVNLDKVEKINLAKEEVHKICLTKTPLNGLKAMVFVVIDFSWSMEHYYKDGTVQNTLEKILPIAMEFDDDQSVQTWIFENGYKRLADMNLQNFDNYVQREIFDKRYVMGGTEYAPVINDVIDAYKRMAKGNNIPAYVIFITDGDTSNADRAKNAIIEASKLPIFWQFVGVGNSDYSFLQELDDMEGRYVDNADFFAVDKPENISYIQLLNEFPSWLIDEKVKAMLG